ncbi:MAG: hypothetical protein L0387_05060 [Acidobacteria bacterium]|nr:hypothetical protein [Acidobacteriota bacterium]MCI0621032.1 hypothetical protein [Acidobacteriota bacterium]MCI0721792.1 hypothetical protein [Acidobacteriota bacterium]
MIVNEALIQSIVRNVVQRLQDETLEGAPRGGSVAATPASRMHASLENLYQSYRARYLHPSPSEERFSVEFDSSLPVELGRPLVCLYEKHQPCDSCGRCEFRGF